MILGNVSQYPFKSLLKGDDSGESSVKMGPRKWKYGMSLVISFCSFRMKGAFSKNMRPNGEDQRSMPAQHPFTGHWP